MERIDAVPSTGFSPMHMSGITNLHNVSFVSVAAALAYTRLATSHERGYSLAPVDPTEGPGAPFISYVGPGVRARTGSRIDAVVYLPNRTSITPVHYLSVIVGEQARISGDHAREYGLSRDLVAPTTVITAICLVDRMIKRRPGVFRGCTAVRLLAAALSVARKVSGPRENVVYGADESAAVLGLDAAEFARLESAFLELLDWDVAVSRAEFITACRSLVEWATEHVPMERLFTFLGVSGAYSHEDDVYVPWVRPISRIGLPAAGEPVTAAAA